MDFYPDYQINVFGAATYSILGGGLHLQSRGHFEGDA